MSTELEKKSLEAHVDLCAVRYEQLDNRLTKVEQKLEKIESDVSDIKSMLNRSQKDQFKVLLSISGAIITVLLGIIGYLFINH